MHGFQRLIAAAKPRPLRRLDQAAIAALAVVSLALLAVYWLSYGGHLGGIVEIDRASHQPAAFIVDINSAGWPEIAQLPGIGETLARRIVESRNQQGPFADHDDLRRVRGIGPRTLERLKPHLQPLPARANVADRD